ncbi:MAG: hypothetical protein IJ397_05795 [Lachnospiraceae bacterium]|nr:hypothetical protein [Lachnospiraceae bacterium]
MILHEFKTETNNNVYIINADFLTCDFKRMQDEYKENKRILWKTGTKGNKGCKVGDIIYFYYFNLPSATSKLERRILLKGTVCEETKKMEEGKVYRDDRKTIVDAFAINNLQTIELNDYKKFNRESLMLHYNFPARWGNVMILYEDKKQLYYDIEDSIANNKNGDFDDLIKYFEAPCFFQDILHPNKDPLSFYRRSNNLKYYEKHHFVPEHTKKYFPGNQKYADIIDNAENFIHLCPYCHRKIHLGTSEEIAFMLEEIYKIKKDFLKEKQINKFVSEDVLLWLKQIYNANVESDD